MNRRDLLPRYISQEAWVDLCDAIDYVFKDRVDDPTDILGKLRLLFLFNDVTIQNEENQVLTSESQLDMFEKDILVKQLTMVGLSLANQDNFSQEELQRMVRYLPTYWYGKGKNLIADFVSLVLNIEVKMFNLWTQDYVEFYDEGDPAIGTPIYEGGTWYPTTHTRVEYDENQINPSITSAVFINFFESLANYVLVFQYLVQSVTLETEPIDAHIAPIFFDYDTVANFSLDPDTDLVSSRGQGGYTQFQPIATDNN